MKKYNIIFMGTPEFSVPSLLKLSKLHNIKAVFTKKPKKSGRGMKLTISPVNIIAKKIGIKCFYPDTLCDNRIFETINLLNCHIIVVVAYGLKLPESILKKPNYKGDKDCLLECTVQLELLAKIDPPASDKLIKQKLALEMLQNKFSGQKNINDQIKDLLINFVNSLESNKVNASEKKLWKRICNALNELANYLP